MSIDAALVFAAGFGTRMRPLTDSVPKPMIRVCSKPMIDHALDIVRHAGIQTIAVNTHYKAEILHQHLAGTEVQISHEIPNILDTGGGLRHALSLLGTDPVVTMNPDAIWAGPNPVELVCEHWDPHKMDALLLCVDPRNAQGTTSPGDFFIGPSGKVSRGPGWIYGGVQIVKTNRLKDVGDSCFSLNVLWDMFAQTSRLFGLKYPGKWCDVGHPEGLALAESLLGNANHVP